MTHLSMGMSLEGSMDGLREDVPDWRREMEVGESRTEGRRKDVGLVSSEGRRDMANQGDWRGRWSTGEGRETVRLRVRGRGAGIYTRRGDVWGLGESEVCALWGWAPEAAGCYPRSMFSLSSASRRILRAPCQCQLCPTC